MWKQINPSIKRAKLLGNFIYIIARNCINQTCIANISRIIFNNIMLIDTDFLGVGGGKTTPRRARIRIQSAGLGKHHLPLLRFREFTFQA